MVRKEKLHGGLTPEERAEALDAIKQGMFLMQHGYSEPGFTERYLGRLHQLRDEYAQAIPFLQAARRKLTGLDLVAADQALIVSFIKTGQLEEARKLALFGAGQSGQYAPMYQNMLLQVEAQRATNPPASR